MLTYGSVVTPAEGKDSGSGTPRTRTSALNAPVLLLNRHYAPVSVTTARRGMVLLFGGSAVALDEDGAAHDFTRWRTLPVRETDDRVPIVGGQLRVPRVLHLLRYDRAPRFGVRLTRRNLLLRDAYRCQYCGEEPGVRELNVDHVMPRSRGGRDTWDNLVISCRGCNLRKGKRTPDEAGMLLLRKPVKPGWSTAAHIVLTTRAPFSEWHPFLGTS
jgi:5-methylcytosine-specific restriction endonuclease McrA